MAIIDLPRAQAVSGSTEQQLKAISDQIRVFRDQVERQLTDLESGTGTVDTAASSAALSQIVSDISDIQNDIETIQSVLPGKLEASDLSTIENSINTINTTLSSIHELPDVLGEYLGFDMALEDPDTFDGITVLKDSIEDIKTNIGVMDLDTTAYDLTGAINEHETDINTINTALGNKLDTTGDGKDVTVSATAADIKANLSTGEKLSVSVGKLMKWFSDFATVAWSGSYNDLSDKPSPSSAGFLDAHPVGSVYITTNNDESTAAQMGTKYGGTWVAASEGRAIFGAGDNGQTSIAFGDKLGDAYLQAHTHVGGSHTHTLGAHRHGSSNGGGFMVNTGGTKNLASGTSTNREIVSYTNYAGDGTTSGASAHNTGAANGSTGNDNNFPPYEAFYVYKRTA